MSRLWPDTLSVGLFSRQSCMRRGRVDLGRMDTTPLATPAELLVALQAMLAQHALQLGKRSRVDLVLSDSAAVTVALPWQAQLTTPEELHSYGQGCFEQQGMEVDEAWVMQAGFRQYQSAGMAYALRKDWLQQLLAMLEPYGLRLGSVLPLSAAAYWYPKPPSKKGRSLQLLSETRRVTALMYETGHFVGIDVEPVVTDTAAATSRLFKRLAATSSEFNGIAYWHVDGAAQKGMADFLATCLPEAAIHPLNLAFWS